MSFLGQSTVTRLRLSIDGWWRGWNTESTPQCEKTDSTLRQKIERRKKNRTVPTVSPGLLSPACPSRWESKTQSTVPRLELFKDTHPSLCPHCQRHPGETAFVRLFREPWEGSESQTYISCRLTPVHTLIRVTPSPTESCVNIMCGWP